MKAAEKSGARAVKGMGAVEKDGRPRVRDERARGEGVESERVRGERVRGEAGGLSGFARSLLREWRRLELPFAVERVVAAVSGGADSTALLLALEELAGAGYFGPEIVVAHLDHGLRGEGGAEDARWVEELAARLGFKGIVGRASVGERAALSGDNLEQAARRARYEFLARAAVESGARVVLAAHTMDDQAETVLLRLMRGSGAGGLGGMESVRELDQKSGVLLVRPLLNWARRDATESYCRERGVEPRVDRMNEDERFARVRVRQKLLPLMLTFNGRVVEALARTAELLREDAAALGPAAERLLEEASAVGTEAARAMEREKAKEGVGGVKEEGAGVVEENAAGSTDLADSDGSPELLVEVLREAPRGLRRRALRLWLARRRGDTRRLELVHLKGVEALLEGERGGRVALLPGGARVYRKRGRLYLLTSAAPPADEKS